MTDIAPIAPGVVQELAALHAHAFPRGWSEEEILDLLARGAFGYWASPPAPVAFALAWAPGGDAEILTLVTAEAARRRGWGGKLMAATIAHAAALGAEAMVLEVGVGNGAARALYDGLGFREIGRRPRYYERGGASEDALIMKLILSRTAAETFAAQD
ncbi:MAG: GNAT family N-acetyltransferase [Alphaproteobacteria bacterium]|nr:GNAT family N-acetyltransferase [Alphaproteobacteria bacterium]